MSHFFRGVMVVTNEFWHRFLTDESGQGITEYGAILAFVAILVALVFSLTQGALKGAICTAFSAVAKQLNNLASAAGAAS